MAVQTASHDTGTVPMLEEGLQNRCGRGMSRTSNSYKLPVDKEERERLSAQHMIWRLLFGGNGLYPPQAEELVSSVLNIQSEKEPLILEIGSGSGAWSVEMARLFPHTTVLGLDLTESRPENRPPNCQFMTRDVTNGLDEYFGKVDIIHIRSVVGHIIDAPSILHTIGRCLRPGGLLLLGDGNRDLFDKDRNRLPPADLTPGANNDGCSWMSGWMNALTARAAVDGKSTMSGEDQPPLVRADGQFHILGEEDYYCPMGWDGGNISNGEQISHLWTINISRFLQSSKGLFLTTGESNETVDGWIRNVLDDVPPHLETLFKFSFLWAQKLPEA